MFGAASSFGECLVPTPVPAPVPASAARVLLFGEPGAARDRCVRELGARGGEVRVAGLQILIRVLRGPEGWSGAQLGMEPGGPPQLVVVLDDRGAVPAPPPVAGRCGALWVRIGGSASISTPDASPWDGVLTAPVSPDAWEEIVAQAGGAVLFRRRSLEEPGVRDAWMRYLARVSRDPLRAAPSGGERTEAPRVLLVEDDPVVAEVTRRRLRQQGAEVTVARGVRAAMREFRAGAWDLVLADIRLGLDSGVRLVAEMRGFEAAEGREPGRILAFGEAPEGREAVEGRASDFDGRVPKPLSDADLREALLGVRDRAGGGVDAAPRAESRVREEARRILAAEAPRLVLALRTALHTRSGEGPVRLRALAHRLQGTAAVVGDAGLGEAASAVEFALDAASHVNRAGELRGAVERLVAQLERHPAMACPGALP